MARNLFSGRPGDFVALAPSSNSGFVKAAASLTTGTVWTAQTGGTQVTDLQTAGGSTITTVSTDADGYLIPFQGPNGVDVLWVDFGGSRRLLESQSFAANIATTQATTVINTAIANGLGLNPGPSAYQVAVTNGFVGTQQNWLDSLKGATGATTVATERIVQNPDGSYPTPVTTAPTRVYIVTNVALLPTAANGAQAYDQVLVVLP